MGFMCAKSIQSTSVDISVGNYGQKRTSEQLENDHSKDTLIISSSTKKSKYWMRLQRLEFGARRWNGLEPLQALDE